MTALRLWLRRLLHLHLYSGRRWLVLGDQVWVEWECRCGKTKQGIYENN